MNTVLNILFSTTLLYARVNGGVIGAQGVPGVWTGPTGHTGALGGWSGPLGYSGVPALAGSPGYWPGNVGTPEGWTGPSGYAGASRVLGAPGIAVGPVGYVGPKAVPQILPDGSIADVPEVVAARAAHLAAVQAAYTDPRAADGDDGEYTPYKYGDNVYFQHTHHANTPIGYNGGFRPNPALLQEEAAWRAKQSVEAQRAYTPVNSYANAEAALSSLIAKNAAASATPTLPSGELVRPYAGPLATPQVLPSGYITDTVEVNVTRQNHLRALAETEAAAAQWPQKSAGWN